MSRNRLQFIPVKPNQLQIDIDSRWGRGGQGIPLYRLRLIGAVHPITSVRYSRSRSGNTHCTITLARRIGHYERIALQLICGDDPHRALMSWRRVRARQPFPVIFFEKKPLR